MPIQFWRDDFFRTLTDLAAEAAKTPAWTQYASYCLEYERGLRRQAFATLDQFICSLEGEPFAERRRFVSWLLTVSDGTPGQHMAIPHPLRIRIIEPTLAEWVVTEPQCAEPHRWIGDQEHLRQAITIDPADALARQKLIAGILSYIFYSTHELPRYYIGDPEADLRTLQEAEDLLKALPDGEAHQQLEAEIVEYRGKIRAYLEARGISL